MTRDVNVAFGVTDLRLPSASPAVAESIEHILSYTQKATMCFLQRQQDRRMRLMNV
jgi:hypothetical protein